MAPDALSPLLAPNASWHPLIPCWPLSLHTPTRPQYTPTPLTPLNPSQWESWDLDWGPIWLGPQSSPMHSWHPTPFTDPLMPPTHPACPNASWHPLTVFWPPALATPLPAPLHPWHPLHPCQWECWDPWLGPIVVGLPIHLPPPVIPWHPLPAPQCPLTPCWSSNAPNSLHPLLAQNASWNPLTPCWPPEPLHPLMPPRPLPGVSAGTLDWGQMWPDSHSTCHPNAPWHPYTP